MSSTDVMTPSRCAPQRRSSPWPGGGNSRNRTRPGASLRSPCPGTASRPPPAGRRRPRGRRCWRRTRSRPTPRSTCRSPVLAAWRPSLRPVPGLGGRQAARTGDRHVERGVGRESLVRQHRLPRGVLRSAGGRRDAVPGQGDRRLAPGLVRFRLFPPPGEGELRLRRVHREGAMTSALLIYPFFRRRLDRSRFRFPPLGVAYVAASLREAGHSVQVLDCTFLSRDEAVSQALAARADVVGIYCMATMKEDCLGFARALRGRCRLLVAGGPLPTCEPEAFVQDFDAVVRGEGEQTMLEILAAHQAGADLASVPGVVCRRKKDAPARRQGRRRPG